MRRACVRVGRRGMRDMMEEGEGVLVCTETGSRNYVVEEKLQRGAKTATASVVMATWRARRRLGVPDKRVSVSKKIATLTPVRG